MFVRLSSPTSTFKWLATLDVFDREYGRKHNVWIIPTTMPGKKNMLAIQATGSKFKSSNEAMGSGRFR